VYSGADWLTLFETKTNFYCVLLLLTLLSQHIYTEQQEARAKYCLKCFCRTKVNFKYVSHSYRLKKWGYCRPKFLTESSF